MSDPALVARRGPRPRTTSTNPHTQLDQQPADDTVRAVLHRQAFSLPGVRARASGVSVPGARALWLDEAVPPGPAEAFLVEREFAHLHPLPDQSLHLTLPPDMVERAIDAGWAERHPLAEQGAIPASVVMVYAPRDPQELEVVYALVLASYRFASAGGSVAW
jgi:hypothetical protein